MRIVLRKGEADQRGHQSQVHQRTVLKKKKKRIQPPLQLCLLGDAGPHQPRLRPPRPRIRRLARQLPGERVRAQTHRPRPRQGQPVLEVRFIASIYSRTENVNHIALLILIIFHYFHQLNNHFWRHVAWSMILSINHKIT